MNPNTTLAVRIGFTPEISSFGFQKKINDKVSELQHLLGECFLHNTRCVVSDSVGADLFRQTYRMNIFSQFVKRQVAEG